MSEKIWCEMEIPEGVEIPKGELRVILKDKGEVVIQILKVDSMSGDQKCQPPKFDRTLGGFVGFLKDSSAFEEEDPLEYQRKARYE